jgi:PGF-pre-PGF domain-containing protein
VFGEITDSNGEDLKASGSVKYNGDVLAEFQANSSGYYNVMVPGGDYEGEKLDILVEGEKVAEFSFEALGVTEKDFVYSEGSGTSDEGTDSQGGGSSGGGSLPSVNESEKMIDEEGNNQTTANRSNPETNTTGNASSEIVQTERKFNQVRKGQKLNVQVSDSPQDDSRSTGSSSTGSGGFTTSITFISGSDADSGKINVSVMRDGEEDVSRETEGKKPVGEVYRYTRVDTNIEAENVSFNFQIPEEDLESLGDNPQEVVQQRFSNGTWNELRTTYNSKLNKSYNFTAYSPEGFSLFAVTVQNEQRQEKKSSGDIFLDLYSVLLTAVIMLLIFSVYSNKNEIMNAVQRIKRSQL